MNSKTLSSEGVYFFGDSVSFSVFVVFLITVSVAFVNGLTDAPNAIASCVTTRCLDIKKAVLLASVFDLAGGVAAGLFSNNVTQTVMSVSDFGNNPETAVASLCAAMCSVVIWALAAWKFGIPTSESHALIAGIMGAAVAVNKSFNCIDMGAIIKVLWGLFVSVFPGFLSGFFLTKLTSILFVNVPKDKSDLFFKYSQILSGMIMAFMHGAQDSQKFTGILMLAISYSVGIKADKAPVWLIFLCSCAIAAGTASGGERIIKAVGFDMLRLRKDQGFAADISGAVCLLVSTLCGFPVSTTHTKTSALMGAGVAKSPKSVNWNVAKDIILAWFLTFPCCGFLGWLLTMIILNV